MFELVIKGGVVVGPRGRAPLDVCVRDGKIAALLPPGSAAEAASTVDAGGLLVLPGMVDTHVHLMDPGDESREDFPHGSLAAACSGVTTIIEHTHGWPVTSVDKLAEKRAHLKGRSNVDYGLASHIWDDEGQDLAGLWRAGVSFFKIFTCSTHGVPACTNGRLLDVLDTLAYLGAPALVHCEDEDMTASAERRLREMGRDDPGVVVEWRSLPAELVAVSAVALIAGLSGARVTIAHASSTPTLEVLERARGGAGLGAGHVLAETCPQYLFLEEAGVYEQGPLRKFTPPARARTVSDTEGMWLAFNRGAIQILSSDHAPSTMDQKRSGGIWQAPFGLPGLDTTVRLMLDAALSGRTSLERLVEAYSQAPARHYGLVDKGRLSKGADADIVLVDPSAHVVISDETVKSKAGWTPYAGRHVRGSIVSVFLRGEMIVDGGAKVADPRGRFIPGPGAVALP